MPARLVVALYVVVCVYASVLYLLGPVVPIATIAMGFGLPIIVYLALEWVAAPLVAFAMGVQTRWWSVPAVLVFCSPVVLLFAVATPLVSSGSESLAVPVPWIAVAAKVKSQVGSLIRERVAWWGGLHAIGLVCGWSSRQVWPLEPHGG